MAAPVRVIFLGGLGEIGRNCMVIEQDNRLLLIDCGLMFPDADMHGIDLVLPDFTWLRENADRIEACVATHGHEDHVGGLQFLLREMSFPIYGSQVTLGLARNRIEEAGLLKKTELITVRDGERINIGPFDVEFLPVTHSVPHAHAVIVHTPQGVIVHSGDFKLDLKGGLINPINKTVCGQSFFNDPLLTRDGLISTPEAGQIKNQVPEYDKVGLRFFYLRSANNATTLRYPVFRRRNDYGEIIDQNVYKVITTVKLQGRTINGDFSTIDLRFADKNGNTFAAYDYLLETERFRSNGRAKITFYAAFPNSYFVNGYFFNKKFTLSTGETVVVKSFSDAKMHNQYIYGKVEAIFVD